MHEVVLPFNGGTSFVVPRYACVATMALRYGAIDEVVIMCATYYARTSDHGYETNDKPKPPLSATGANVTAISVAVMALASAATVLLTIKRRRG